MKFPLRNNRRPRKKKNIIGKTKIPSDFPDISKDNLEK